jgi:hypothetical protein
MISLLDRSELEDGVLSGAITTFIDFDERGAWFNTENLTEATDDQISEVRIPQNLRPNSASFYFYFDIISHKLYFQTYSRGKTFTPKSAHRFFSSLSRDINVMGRFGEAKITIIQDKASIKRLFGVERIKLIEITILKPNPDIFDEDFESRIEAHLEEVHSRQLSLIYKAEPGSSLTPTDDVRDIGRVALENGGIKVVGRDKNGAVTLNSNDFPQEFHDRFDPEATNERAAFQSLIPPRKGKAN